MFVVFEGLDGAGKSTQARLLADRLRQTGAEVVLTREPGGSPGAEEIRRLILSEREDGFSPETEILLFNAARRDHVERVIRPALDRGAIVICDRFVLSTLAYQALLGQEMVDLALRVHEAFIGISPDLTLILERDDAAAAALARGGLDRLDRRSAENAAVMLQVMRDNAPRFGEHALVPFAPITEVAERVLSSVTFHRFREVDHGHEENLLS